MMRSKARTCIAGQKHRAVAPGFDQRSQKGLRWRSGSGQALHQEVVAPAAYDTYFWC